MMKRRISLATLALCAAAGATAGTTAPPRPRPIKPPSRAAIDKAMKRGIAFLLKSQNKNGSWGSATRTKGLNIYAPVPGAHHAFRTAVTALCVSALIEVDDGSEAIQRAVERGEAWIVKELPRLRRATPRAIYNVWGHAYSIQALVRMVKRLPTDTKRRETLEELVRQQIDLLGRYESVYGGWGYYDFGLRSQKPGSRPNSFTTATVLVALREAKEIGIEAPQRLIRRAIATVHRQQNPDFTYHYSEGFKWWPVARINRPGGSLGRSQACNVALRLWGDKKITDTVLKVWLDRLFARNGWLSIGRKRPVPHESWFAVAGYFFYYGHYYAALCVDQLPPNDRPHCQNHLADILLRVQDGDGSWWDYPLYNYHQPYGTAFALMTLHRCRRPPARQ